MLAIGRALMSRPKLLLLDEPSLGLAPLIVKQIFEVVRELNRNEGLTVFLVEQNAFHALRLAHRGYVMVNGQITPDRHRQGTSVARGGSQRLSRRRGTLMQPQMSLLWEVAFPEFLFVTVILGGGGAWMIGRSTALTWSGWGLMAFYVLLLTVAVRFIHFSLFGGSFFLPPATFGTGLYYACRSTLSGALWRLRPPVAALVRTTPDEAPVQPWCKRPGQ